VNTEKEMQPSSSASSSTVDVAYALITLGGTVIWSVLGNWLLYFYFPPEGEGSALVPAALYGGVMLVLRVINALIALPIGYLSDHTRSPWGRRLPYMFASAGPMLLFFILLWRPPVATESMTNLIYLTLVFLLYNLAYTFNQIPYTALLPELATTDHRRVRISTWSSSFLLVGMVVGTLAGPVIQRFGYATMGVFCAVLCVPLFYGPFFVLREHRARWDKGAHEVSERLAFWDGLGVMLKNRPFLIMTATGACYWGITTLVQAVVPYIVTEICLLDPGDTTYFYIPGILAALICYPVVMWLSDRFGKWRVFAASLLASALVLPGLMGIGPWLPLSLTAQGVIWVILQAAALSGVIMLPPAFGAEITDYDEELTGQRREGVYYAAWGVLDQVINGLAAAGLPLLLTLGRSHTDPRGPLGVRMVGVVGGVLMFVGFLIFLNYPLRGSRAATPEAAEAGE
jgi:GPH family glycoside/pentoside/hexuronide:cation symporter